MDIKEKRDKIFYDTRTVEPGQSVRFFTPDRDSGLGDRLITNMLIGGMLPAEWTHLVYAIGARVIGSSRDEEDRLLDHIRMSLSVMDRETHDIMGPHASMLRHIFSREELDRLEVVSDENPNTDDDGVINPGFDCERRGYHFAIPIMIPARCGFDVLVEATRDLPRAVHMRIHLFGINERSLV